jgi:hypothetical protein
VSLTEANATELLSAARRALPHGTVDLVLASDEGEAEYVFRVGTRDGATLEERRAISRALVEYCLERDWPCAFAVCIAPPSDAVTAAQTRSTRLRYPTPAFARVARVTWVVSDEYPLLDALVEQVEPYVTGEETRPWSGGRTWTSRPTGGRVWTDEGLTGLGQAA